MINRLYTVAALTAAIALSASFALSRTGTDHGHSATPAAAHASSAGASHLASASVDGAGFHANQPIAAAAASFKSRVGQAPYIAAAAASSTTPTLVTTQGPAHELARGAQKATPVSVSEDQAMQAIFKGGMWLPGANGGREYAKYDHHLIHDDGDWTWVGKVQTDHGLQSAVITFGKDAVFGRIPQANGSAMRLVTADGQKLLVQTDGAKMASSAESLRLHARQDFMVPHHAAAASGTRTKATASAQTVSAASAETTASATTSGSPTIDVMVAYTSGFASAQGGASAALTRINNLVDITNQAYADSGVNQRVRLVHTMQVSYTDTNDNANALHDLTGKNEDGTSVTIPASLQSVASTRVKYGADLVVLLRRFNDAGNNGCGIGWLIGGGEQQIIPSEDNAFGYSVVQDGSDNGYYCLDTTFAHELGHNMGSAHDRANADQPGAYSYSYGYLGNGTSGFSTIMAYGSDTSTPLSLFSNPNISKCQNSPCGVADSSTSSADNVHSLNNTAGLIAQFEATKVAGILPIGQYPHTDLNGDGKEDLLWRQLNSQLFANWQMSGPTVQQRSSATYIDSSTYALVAADRFFGQGTRGDLVWANGSSIWMWQPSGSSYNYLHVSNMPTGWRIIGSGDIDGDGKPDLIFRNVSNTSGKGGLAYWRMDGARVLSSSALIPMSPDYHLAAIGDFNSDGRADIAWSNGSQMVLWQSTGTGFTQVTMDSQPAGWQLIGCGDVNGDGKCDLLWRNQSSGAIAYWLMNGPSVTYKSKAFVPPNGYAPATLGDFNGDGRVDIVLSNKASMLMWASNGAGFSSTQFSDYPSGWLLSGAPRDH